MQSRIVKCKECGEEFDTEAGGMYRYSRGEFTCPPCWRSAAGPLRISGPSQGKGKCDDGGDYAVVEPGGIIIGEAFHRVGEDAYRDAEANARLWADAPALLEALEALGTPHPDGQLCFCLRWAALNEVSARLLTPTTWKHSSRCKQARAAVAAARGGEGVQG